MDTKPPHSVLSPEAVLYLGDAFEVLDCLPADSVHAVVTDAPYRNLEYAADQQAKLRGGRGGVWRIPPTLDGRPRRPVPRFTVLSEADRSKMEEFFGALARALLRPLVPGAHVLIASNPLLSEHVFLPFVRNGFEKRGMVIREVRTLRGGDRRGIPGLVGDAAFGS